MDQRVVGQNYAVKWPPPHFISSKPCKIVHSYSRYSYKDMVYQNIIHRGGRVRHGPSYWQKSKSPVFQIVWSRALHHCWLIKYLQGVPKKPTLSTNWKLTKNFQFWSLTLKQSPRLIGNYFCRNGIFPIETGFSP